MFKPRGLPHAFWNAGAAPARLLEVISPGGFAQYFLDLAALLAPGRNVDPAAMVALGERYGMAIDLGSVARPRDKHGLTMGRALVFLGATDSASWCEVLASDEEVAEVKMVLTTPFCPYGTMLIGRSRGWPRRPPRCRRR